MAVVVISFLLLVFSIFLFNRLGGEFIPTLEEGDLAAGVMTLQGGSLSNTVEKVIAANKILLENFPEVKHAACKVGAGEIPTDPTPMETGDYIITLKPKSEWTSAKTREELVEKMQDKLGVLAGVKFEFQQPIQMRFNELMSGSKQDVAIKIFGDNLDNLAVNASKVEKIIKTVKGVEDINVEKVTGLPQIQIKYNRMKLAEYELTVEDVNNILKTAFAGSSAGTIYEEEKRFDMVVRLDKQFRRELEDVKNLDISLPCGHLIQLEQLADIQIKEGAAQISREDAKRRITVGFNVRGRDVQSVIEEIQKKIDDKIKFPPGYYVTYGGQFQNLVEANKRLAIAVPAALLLIFVILMFTFHSLKQTLLIFTAVPLSAIGGVIALYLRDMNFSISAGVGFIALFGVAVLNGIVLIAEFNRLEKEKKIDDIYERVRRGIKARLRPVIMTAAVASLGFLPMAVSSSAGSEVQKPLATVVIGGLISSTFLTLIVMPVLYILFSSKKKFRFNFRKRRVIAFLAAFLFLTSFIGNNAFAQNPVKYYNLDQLVNQATQNNGMLRAARLQVESQKMVKRSAVDIDKTSVEFQYGQINSVNNDDNFSINQGFAFPTAYVAKTKLANANLKNANFQVAASENELTKQVKSIYYQLVYLYSQKKLLIYQDSLLSDFVRVASLKSKTGDVNNLEKITAESQSVEVKNKLREAISDIDIYYLKLKNLIAEKSDIMITDSVTTKIDFASKFDSAQMANSPNAQIYRQFREIARYETKVERSKLAPDLSVGYFNHSLVSTEGINIYTPSDRFSGFQAGITIPLFFYPQTAKVKASKINEKIAEETYNYALSSMNSELKVRLEELMKNRNTLDYFEKNALPQSETIISQANLNYKSGNIDYMDYMQSINIAVSIKSGYLEAINSYNQTIIEIEALIGANTKKTTK
jgi:cobalt-zinc-cadmium resistance protein CzcA